MNREILFMRQGCLGPMRYLAIAIAFIVLTISISAQVQVPRFEDAQCAVAVADGVAHRCGVLVVYENRRTKQRAIRLPVIIIKSKAESPEPDPVIYTAGGPGASSLGRARSANRLGAYTDHRDLIIFEQRGTSFARPALQCPEVPEAVNDAHKRQLGQRDVTRAELDAVKRCRDRLAADGIDLGAYDSAASAADMEDLRRVLNINKWNLYGVSYSTRLMLNYVRKYSENVRSMILDSVLPPSVNYDETSVDGVVRSLNVLFGECRTDAKCNAAYPNLERGFYDLIRSADREPLKVDVDLDGQHVHVYLDGASIVDLIYNLLEDSSALADIPFIIDKLSTSDYVRLGPVRNYARQRLTSQGFVWGMRYSVWCREEMPFQDRGRISRQLTKYPRLSGFGIQDTFPDICRVWNVPRSPAIENRPVRSKVPTLVFAGKYDPDTPPEWGRLAASWSPTSYFYEFEGTSHGVLFSNRCAINEIVPSFLKDPTSRPNDKCYAEKAPLEFMTNSAG